MKHIHAILLYALPLDPGPLNSSREFPFAMKESKHGSVYRSLRFLVLLLGILTVYISPLLLTTDLLLPKLLSHCLPTKPTSSLLEGRLSPGLSNQWTHS